MVVGAAAPGRRLARGRERGLGVLRPSAHLPCAPRDSRSGGAGGVGRQPPDHRRQSGAPRETALAPGPALQPVVGWRQGREVRIGGVGHVARSPDRDARPRARPRRAGPRRHRPGRRLPGDGRWRWLTGIGGLHRRGARSSLRMRGRGDAEPLRPRPRAGPPRPAPERVRLPRCHRAPSRLRDGERPVLRQQRLARRLRHHRPARGLPRGQGGHDASSCSPSCWARPQSPSICRS